MMCTKSCQVYSSVVVDTDLEHLSVIILGISQRQSKQAASKSLNVQGVRSPRGESTMTWIVHASGVSAEQFGLRDVWRHCHRCEVSLLACLLLATYLH